MWKKRIILTGWALLAITTVVLLVAAKQKKETRSVADIKVAIEGAEDHVFVDEKEVLLFLKKMGVQKGTEINQVDARRLEEGLKQNKWVKGIELFFDNNEVLQAKIEEREPIARVFTINGSSFYIDDSAIRLPLSDELSARLPVFTSFTSDRKKLSAPDSLLLDDVKKIAQFIHQDSFWMAQVSQVDIMPNRTFVIIPVVGNQTIVLGNADSLQQKFDRLYSFYKQVWAKAGFEKYERIDVQFDGQVIATKRNAAKPFMDSAKAMQQLTNTLEKINAVVNDTLAVTPENRAFISGTTDIVATKQQQENIKAAVQQQENRQIVKSPKAIIKKKTK